MQFLRELLGLLQPYAKPRRRARSQFGQLDAPSGAPQQPASALGLECRDLPADV
jgi:hypothetical protein